MENKLVLRYNFLLQLNLKNKLSSVLIIYLMVNFLVPSWTLAQQEASPPQALSLVETRVDPIESIGDTERFLRIKIEINKGFKTYVDKFKIHVLDPFPVDEGDLEAEPVVEFYDKFSKKNKKGLIGTSTLTLPFHFKQNTELTPGKHKLKFELRYQACTDTYCYFPQSIEGESEFVIINSTTPTETLPKSTSGLFSKTDGLLQDTFISASERGLVYLFIFVFLAGVLTSLTPCLLPILPITIAVLGKGHGHDKKWIKFKNSLIYVLGVATTYSLLGLIAASSGSLFGSLLSQPIVQLSFALLFIIMGIAQFGFFEIQTPLKMQNLFHKWGHDTKGIFATGLLSGLIASPCVGPVLVGILTYIAQTQNKWLGFWLMFDYAMGMGQLLLVVGVSTQLLYKFPKNPVLMKASKTILGLALIASGLFYMSLLWPKTNTIFNGPIAESPTQHSTLQWQNYSKELLSKAKQDNKPVIVDFFADWCLACKELEAKTFIHPEVEKILSNFVLLRYDATNPSDELNQLKKEYGIVGLPSVFFYSKDGTLIKNATLNEFEEPEIFKQRLLNVLSSSSF